MHCSKKKKNQLTSYPATKSPTPYALRPYTLVGFCISRK